MFLVCVDGMIRLDIQYQIKGEREEEGLLLDNSLQALYECKL